MVLVPSMSTLLTSTTSVSAIGSTTEAVSTIDGGASVAAGSQSLPDVSIGTSGILAFESSTTTIGTASMPVIPAASESPIVLPSQVDTTLSTITIRTTVTASPSSSPVTTYPLSVLMDPHVAVVAAAPDTAAIPSSPSSSSSSSPAVSVQTVYVPTTIYITNPCAAPSNQAAMAQASSSPAVVASQAAVVPAPVAAASQAAIAPSPAPAALVDALAASVASPVLTSVQSAATSFITQVLTATTIVSAPVVTDEVVAPVSSLAFGAGTVGAQSQESTSATTVTVKQTMSSTTTVIMALPTSSMAAGSALVSAPTMMTAPGYTNGTTSKL